MGNTATQDQPVVPPLMVGPDGSDPANQPTVVVNSAVAGTGATATIEGNNMSGTITLTTGTNITVGGAVLTLTLAGGATFSKKMKLHFTSANDQFAGVYTKLYATKTKNTATLYVVGLSLVAGTTYMGDYWISGW